MKEFDKEDTKILEYISKRQPRETKPTELLYCPVCHRKVPRWHFGPNTGYTREHLICKGCRTDGCFTRDYSKNHVSVKWDGDDNIKKPSIIEWMENNVKE